MLLTALLYMNKTCEINKCLFRILKVIYSIKCYVMYYTCVLKLCVLCVQHFIFTLLP